MWQGTTPTVEITTDIDLTTMASVELTILDRKDKRLVLSNDRLTVTSDSVTFRLSQADTSGLTAGRVRLQLRVKTTGGDILASNIMYGDLQIPVYEGEL